MSAVTIAEVTDVALDELVGLYDAVGWSAYTKAPDLLRAAVAGSSCVVVARRGPRLVGLARALSDGATICYLQDVLARRTSSAAGSGGRWFGRSWTAIRASGRRSC